ncbi:MAG: hypothetical protein L0229_01040 [Blastocatellia bacterium]|nr:hypothetical protein [Blastocatellia bacterium]
MSGLIANLREYWMVHLLSVIMGLYWRRGSGPAVIASFAAGTATLLLWEYAPGGKQIHEVFPALFLSLLAYIVVSLRTGVNEAEEVKRLFQGAGAAACAPLERNLLRKKFFKKEITTCAS